MSNWKIVVSPIAKKRIVKIPDPDRKRILQAINSLHSGLSGDVKPLNGRDEWRLRVGGWRVLMNVDIPNQIIAVLFVGSRGDIYKK